MERELVVQIESAAALLILLLTGVLFLRRMRRAVVHMARVADTRRTLIAAAITLCTGTVFYHAAEGWGWIDSLYFSVITLATVGYGDFTPKTLGGKVFTIGYLAAGVTILANFIQAVAQIRDERRD